MLLGGMFYSVRYVYEIDSIVDGRCLNVIQSQCICSCRRVCEKTKKPSTAESA